MTAKQESPPSPTTLTKDNATRNSGGGRKTFPFVIHQMLSQAERDGFTHIVSWQPHGRAFRIHKHKEFMQGIMPDLFRQSKWSSFQRQLNLYGFNRITVNGPDKGAYHHALFLKGQPTLSRQIIRRRVKGTKRRVASNPDDNPDFYAMAPLSDNLSGGVHNDSKLKAASLHKDKITPTEGQIHHYYDGHHHQNNYSNESDVNQHYETHRLHHHQAQHFCFGDDAFVQPRTVTPPGSRSTSLSLQSKKINSDTHQKKKKKNGDQQSVATETDSMSLTSAFRRSFMKVPPNNTRKPQDQSRNNQVTSTSTSSSMFPQISPVASSSTKRRDQEYSQPTTSNSNYNDAFDDIDYMLSNDSKSLLSSIEGENHNDVLDLMGLDFAMDSVTDISVV